jgi:hypothetical protein
VFLAHYRKKSTTLLNLNYTVFVTSRFILFSCILHSEVSFVCTQNLSFFIINLGSCMYLTHSLINLPSQIHRYNCVHIYVHVHTYTQTHKYTHARASTYTHTHRHIHTRARARARTPTHIYAHTHIRAHTHTHTHTHTVKVEQHDCAE